MISDTCGVVRGVTTASGARVGWNDSSVPCRFLAAVKYMVREAGYEHGGLRKTQMLGVMKLKNHSELINIPPKLE